MPTKKTYKDLDEIGIVGTSETRTREQVIKDANFTAAVIKKYRAAGATKASEPAKSYFSASRKKTSTKKTAQRVK